MTTSIKPILRKNKTRSDGKAPLYIRVTKNRKTSFRSVGIFVAPQHWDESALRIKKGHPNAARANHVLFDLLAKLNDELLGHAVQGVALDTEFGPEGEEYFHRLCRYSEKYNFRQAGEYYKSVSRSNQRQITFGTIVHLARERQIEC